MSHSFNQCNITPPQANRKSKIENPVSLLFLLVLLFSACHKKDKHQEAEASSAKNSWTKPMPDIKTLRDSLSGKHIDFEWLALHYKADAEGNGSSISFNGGVKMKRDSVIWMNFLKFGIEAGRALFTKDSAFVINRLQKEYYALSYKQLERKFGFSLNFKQLQAIVAGDFNEFINDSFKNTVSPENGLSSSGKFDRSALTLNFLSNRFLVQKAIVENEGGVLEMFMDKYEPIEQSSYFSKQRKVKAASGENTMNAELEVTKVDLNQVQRIDFSIPNNYKKVY